MFVRRTTLCLLPLLAWPATSLAGPLFAEHTKLVPEDPQAGAAAGTSVAVDADTVVSGAIGTDSTGAAYIHDRDEGGADEFGQVAKLSASDAESADEFGTAADVSGDTVIIGTVGSDSAYLFARNEGGVDAFGQVVILVASDMQLNDAFGRSTALHQDLAVVGAPGKDVSGPDEGAAYVFGRDQGGSGKWGEMTRLTGSGATGGWNLGRAVAVAGDTVVVGSSGRGVWIFQRDEGGADNWGEVAMIQSSDFEVSDGFGAAVSIDGDLMLVGAPTEDGSGSKRGAAYLFGRDTGGTDNWGEIGKLAPDQPEEDANFGAAVAISGDVAAVGSPTRGANEGAVFVYVRDEGGADTWGQTQMLVASDGATGDVFGRSLAVDGLTMVVGSRSTEQEVNDGAAYVFRGTKADGDSCLEPSDCASGFCVDEVCCESACEGGTCADGICMEDGGTDTGGSTGGETDTGGTSGSTGTTSTTGDGTGSSTGGGTQGGGASEDGGCGCRSSTSTLPWALALLPLLRRRKR